MVGRSSPREGSALGATRRYALETLRAFASEDVAHQILELALHAAREIEVPEEGERLRRFIERHLPEAARRSLGGEAAQAITEALRPMVRMLPGAAETSHVRSRAHSDTRPRQPVTKRPDAEPDRPSLTWSASPPGTPTTPPAPSSAGPSSGSPLTAKPAASPELELDMSDLNDRPTATPPELALPMVILATRDEAREAEIRLWLGGRAALQVAHDAVHLLESVELAMNLAPVLLIDCVSPAVRLPTLLLLGEELPRGATVVLWGVPEDETFDDFALSQGAARFIRCGVEASARDVGTLLSPFIDR